MKLNLNILYRQIILLIFQVNKICNILYMETQKYLIPILITPKVKASSLVDKKFDIA